MSRSESISVRARFFPTKVILEVVDYQNWQLSLQRTSADFCRPWPILMKSLQPQKRQIIKNVLNFLLGKSIGFHLKVFTLRKSFTLKEKVDFTGNLSL